MKTRFLVLGASGLVGGHVLQLLLHHGYDAVGASRRQTGHRWVPFDLLDPRTHAPALAGATGVMLLSRPGDELAQQHAQAFIDAMVAAKIQRVVVLSALGAAQRPDFSLRKVELLVEASGLEWTHIRPNFFAQIFARPPLSTEIAAHRTLTLPLGDARVAYVDARDVAAMICKALTEPGLAGKAIDLNGPEALTHETIARQIGTLLGAPVSYVNITEESARDLLSRRGFPAPQAERVLRFYALCRQGACATPDTQAARLLGRPLNRLETALAMYRPVWCDAAEPTRR
jgi:uncharacterized protein YbjT (DUF2867 family)